MDALFLPYPAYNFPFFFPREPIFLHNAGRWLLLVADRVRSNEDPWHPQLPQERRRTRRLWGGSPTLMDEAPPACSYHVC